MISWMRACTWCLWGALLLQVFSSKVSARRRTATAGQTSQRFTIDGRLDEWNIGLFGPTSPIVLSAASAHTEAGMIRNDKDHSVELFVMHGLEHLWIAAIVTDDQVIRSFRGGEIWRGDLLEVFLGRSQQQDLLHIAVGASGDAFIYSATPKVRATDIRAASRITAPGYTLEIAVPYRLLGLQPKAGETLPINFAAKDADADDPVLAHRSWSGFRHNALASLGRLVLLGPSTPRPQAPECVPGDVLEITTPLRARSSQLTSGDQIVRLRILNYQSAEPNWAEFWTDWRPKQIESELELAQRLGANTIRFFIFYVPFGGPSPKRIMLKRLSSLIQMARSKGLLVIPTFFPFMKVFDQGHRAAMEAHLSSIVRRYRGEPTIAMWDLINEPDASWANSEIKHTTAEEVANWAQQMLRATRNADPTHLITFGLRGHFSHRERIRPLEALPDADVISLHFYDDPIAALGPQLERARAFGKPVVLQEFGVSSMLVDETEAASYYRNLCQGAKEHRLAGVGAWELFDHPINTITWLKLAPFEEHPQQYFGLVDSGQRVKAQAQEFCNCLEVPRFRIRN